MQNLIRGIIMIRAADVRDGNRDKTKRRGCYRSIPSEATFPANRAPALPLLDSFSLSLSLLSARVAVFEVEQGSLLRMVGREPSVSFAEDFPPNGGGGTLKADVRAVRWLR